MLKNNINIWINFTVSKINIKEIEPLVLFINSLKESHKIHFFRINPVVSSDEKISLSIKEYYFYLNIIEKLLKSNLSFNIQKDHKFGNYEWGICAAGKFGLYINYKGDVYTCPYIPLCIGNVYENDLFEVYLSKKNRDIIYTIEESINEECKECNFLKHCRGGCIANNSKFDNNNFFIRKDQYCFKNLDVTIDKFTDDNLKYIKYLVEYFFSKSSYQNQIIKLISSKYVYLIKKNRFIIGFLFFINNKITLHIYLYINESFQEKDLHIFNELLNNSIIKNQCYKYIELSHIYDSKNILEKFNFINCVYYMELLNYNNILKYRDYKEYSFSFDIDNNELINFHYFCYYDDKEYMKSNWKELINMFFKKKVPKIIIICRDNKRLIGTCIGWVKDGKKYLFSICVHPDFRHKGLAKIILNKFLMKKPIIESYLSVYADNKNAISLYERFGYVKKRITNIIL